MGNTCCDRREKLPSPTDYDTIPLEKKLREDTLTSEPIWGKYLDTISKPVEQEVKHLSEEEEEIDNAESNSEDEIEEESPKEIQYKLPQYEDMTEDQKEDLKELFNDHIEDEEEDIDSFSKVIEHTEEGDNFDRILIISTNAIYLVDPDDFSILFREEKISDIIFFCFTESLDSVLIVTTEKDLLISAENATEITKCIEQVYIDINLKIIPWHTEGVFADIRKKLNNFSFSFEEFYSKSKAFVVILQDGEIGENIIQCQPCCKSNDFSEDFDQLFVMTNIALYSLNADWKFLKKILLQDIVKIGINEQYESVVVFTTSDSILWNLPFQFTEFIVRAARNIGNLNINLEWLSYQDYISEFLKASKMA